MLYSNGSRVSLEEGRHVIVHRGGSRRQAGADRERHPVTGRGALPRRRARSARTPRRRAALGVREGRLLLPARPRHSAGADRHDVRPGGSIPCAAHGGEARRRGERGQCRLPADEGSASSPVGRRARTPRSSCAATASPTIPLVLAKRRFHGLNQWPAELPGFRETALAYMQAMETLCRRLVPIYATALDLPPDAFDRAYAEPHLILRLTHYPPLAVGRGRHRSA